MKFYFIFFAMVFFTHTAVSQSAFDGFKIELSIPDSDNNSEESEILSEANTANMCMNVSKVDPKYRLQCTQVTAGKPTSKAGADMCMNISRWIEERIQCAEIIAGKPISQANADMCISISKRHFTFRLQCAEIIAKKPISQVNADMCMNISRWIEDKLECLKNINHSQEDDLTKQSVTTSEITGKDILSQIAQGHNEAIEFCRFNVANYDKNHCLKFITQTRFIDTKALSICSNLRDLYKVDCLMSISDKIYGEGIIEECSTVRDHYKRECLNDYGIPFDTLFYIEEIKIKD